ncbi:hypothetical protein ABFX02_01G059900 [Erythranthe guttata]
MDKETLSKIEETVLEILKDSNMDKTTEFQIRKYASQKLGIDLSEPALKKFVREIVESYLRVQQAKAEAAEVEEEEEEDPPEKEEEEENNNGKKGAREYDDEGGIIICRLNDKRRVTLSEFKGKTYLSIREYYKRDGKELPSAKGISLTTEQWGSFKNNIPAIEDAIKTMESRLL